MKKNQVYTFLFAFVVLSLQAVAQESGTAYPIDKDTGLITYQEVVQQPGTADELYVRCIEWINTWYKNPADVCKVRNRESAVIEIHHRFEILNEKDDARLIAGIVNYTLKLEFKPGRYRYSVSDMNLKQASRFPIERWLDKSDSMYTPLWDDYLKQVDTQVKELIESLKAGMQPPVVKQEEKW